MQVKAIRDCFVGSLRKAGEEFDYSGPKNTNLQPVKQSAAPAKPAATSDAKPAAASDAKPAAASDAKPAAAAAGEPEPAK